MGRLQIPKRSRIEAEAWIVYTARASKLRRAREEGISKYASRVKRELCVLAAWCFSAQLAMRKRYRLLSVTMRPRPNMRDGERTGKKKQ